MLGGTVLLIGVAYKMYKEKTTGSQSDENTPKNVPYFDKKREEKDPETKYASLPELTSGNQKPHSLQDDFDADDEDI